MSAEAWRMTRSSRRERGDRGSALMLMPAAVLVMVVLGSLVVDFSLVGVRQRELQNAAAAAANDAATAALDRDALRAGELVLDRDRAREVVAASFAARQTRVEGEPAIEIDPATRSVTVHVRAAHEYVFAKGVPGAPHRFTVTATATATLLVGAGPP